MTQDSLLQKLKNQIHLLQSVFANLKYGFPARDLKIIGVTGTDGKTTTTSMIYHVMNESGLRVGYISTNGAKIGDKELDTGLHVTTPDPWMVPKYLKMMKEAGVKYVVLESTSSGLQQNRLWGIEFDSCVITNIKVDHLDYHGTWENYAKAKFKIIEQLTFNGLAVLNKDDDKSFKWLHQRIEKLPGSTNVVEISQKDVSNLQEELSGMSFDYLNAVFKTKLIGGYNIENTVQAITILDRYLPIEKVAKALKTFKPPKGRMEVITTNPYNVIIDFAHTPSSLESALTSLEKLKNKDQRMIVVFGCAGKRDKSRREMGEVSARLADITILTAEDPRDEKLFDINTEIFEYAKNEKGELISRIKNHNAYKNTKLNVIKQLIELSLKKGNKPFIAFDEDSVDSRIDAIDLAMRIAKEGDIVITTGKAHEQSLAFGEEEKEYEWSEHKAVQNAIERLDK